MTSFRVDGQLTSKITAISTALDIPSELDGTQLLKTPQSRVIKCREINVIVFKYL